MVVLLSGSLENSFRFEKKYTNGVIYQNMGLKRNQNGINLVSIKKK